MRNTVLIALLMALQACSQSDQAINSNKIRMKAVQDAAMSYGAQSALAWQSNKINQQLALKQETLSTIYNFNRIMLPNNVLPPVVREATNGLNLADNKTLRTSDKVIEIIQDAKFVTTPPSWRDYLIMTYEEPEKPVDSMLPQSGSERDIWDKYVAEGWNNGYKQANAILREHLGKLTQDYSGMAFFKKLYLQKMVTAPQVATADLGITGDHKKLVVNDRIIRITSDSQLMTNRSNYWQSDLSISKKVKPIRHGLK